ncbi:uncharacterized protein LOC106662370 isoform X2 [Cimex lectularius]|uniref:F-box domain-containing protein n=1 Tax=Cimex lectularius TaxID=79782 RepID=A0A8I6RB54_CIMLE|nr:uncharacterized protein LOC106662370 isoform X2 [Cimex lectularius]
MIGTVRLNMLDRNNSTIVTRSAAKRRKIEEDDDRYQNSAVKTSLLSLSDDVLLIIFSYLPPADLLSLSKCCQRVANVVCDRSLWERVDLRKTRLTLGELENYTRYLQKNTKFLATRGFEEAPLIDPRKATISKDVLKSIIKNAPNLETLIMENHAIDCVKVTLEEFPPNLLVLRMHKCQMIRMPQERSYFYKLDKVLPHLKVLDLTDCIWFVPHTLLALSKSPKLEQLILKGCNVTECLPYASLAANFGFSVLKTLDLRNTSVTDIEVTCFNRTTSLRNLYLGAYPGDANEDSHVTDYSITTFGGGVQEYGDRGFRERGAIGIDIRDEVVIIDVSACPRPICRLESLILQNYPGITDRSLNHAVTSMPDLKFLDVSHTGVTRTGVQTFRESRPEVKLISTLV